MYTLVCGWNFLRDVFNGNLIFIKSKVLWFDIEKTRYRDILALKQLYLFDAQNDLCKKNIRRTFS
jgi:hypothetical protein